MRDPLARLCNRDNSTRIPDIQEDTDIRGIISLIFGIAGIDISAGLIVGFFQLIAGIIALWKKN
ncbi:MAG TPA: hypothetical protein HA257_05310 [Candidatus Methanoperedenaceae archaeon]|nr:hypothetical protein [Candidatus Methanoperedenaceae archaeon]